MSLTEQLESIAARASAVTIRGDATIDVAAMLAESNPLWTQIGDRPAEMLPVVDRLIASLNAELATAPAAMQEMWAQYGRDAAEAKFDWIDAPPEVVAFVIHDALARIGNFCRSQIAKPTT